MFDKATLRAMSNARLLQRTDVPPLPEDAPVDEIAQWLAREIEEAGHLKHLDATLLMAVKFGSQFTFREPIYNRRGEPLRDKRGRIIQKDRRIHPDILRALKRLTKNTVVWERNACGWHKRKSPA
jgi:hypothetical protein